MKRMVLVCLSLLSLCAVSVTAADVTLQKIIKDANYARLRVAFLYKYPKPSNFIGTEKEWIEYNIGAWLIEIIREYEIAKAVETAKTTASNGVPKNIDK